VADQTAAAVDTYVFRLVIDASVLSRVPVVREAAAAGAGAVAPPAGAKPPAATPARQAGAFLAEVIRQNPIYKDLVLADRQGRFVASSGPAPTAIGRDASWRDALGDGTRGRLVVSDVRYEPKAASWSIEVAAPVEAPVDGQLAGVLVATVDAREIGTVLGGVRMGATGDAALVREDGSFVFAAGPVAPGARFFASDLLRERLAAAGRREPQTALQFGANTAAGSPRLVGVALSQLKASFPHMAWIVAVSQDEDELFAPVRAQATSLVVILGLTAIAVLLFAFWYSVRLSAPFEPEEMDLHLVRHPRIHRLEEPDEVDETVAETV